MSKENDKHEDPFPVLTDVVSQGDESIIKTSRLGHEVIREIEELEEKSGTLSPADISRNITEQQVDQLIDELVQRHADEMRKELKSLIAQLMQTH